MRLERFFALFLVGACWSARAIAQTTPADRALGTQLFNEGRALMSEGRVSEACRKFEESQRLEPALGTLLNLATCHEKEGRTASAWAEFRDALILARRDGRSDRIALAEERLSAVEAKLSRLSVVVHVDPSLRGLDIRRDGQPLPRSAWGVPLPVDPGPHVVEATAAGKKKWTAQVDVGPDADSQSITLERFDDDGTPPDPGPAPSTPAMVPPEDSSPQPSTGRRTLAIAIAGAGLVATGVGGYFGIRAFDKRKESDAECPQGRCSERGVSLNDSAKSAADVSTVAFIVGAAAMGAGVVLWLTSAPAARPPKTTWVPVLVEGKPGLAVTRSF